MGDFVEKWEPKNPPKLKVKKPVRKVLTEASRKLGQVEKKVEHHGRKIRHKEQEAMEKLVGQMEEGGEQQIQASLIADYRKIKNTSDNLEVYVGGMKTRLDTVVALGDTASALSVGGRSVKMLGQHMRSFARAVRNFPEDMDTILQGVDWTLGPAINAELALVMDEDAMKVLAEAKAVAKDVSDKGIE